MVSVTPDALFTTRVVALQFTTVKVPLFVRFVKPVITTLVPEIMVGEKVPVYVVSPNMAFVADVTESTTVAVLVMAGQDRDTPVTARNWSVR